MNDPKNNAILDTGYIKLLLGIYRWLKKYDWGRKYGNRIKTRIIWGFGSALHLQFAHQIRSFMLRATTVGIRNLEPSDCYNLANGLRDVLAQLLDVSPSRLHCTIKLCEQESGKTNQECKIYTIARSDPSNRPAEYYPNFHLAGDNSGFACTLGCNDRKNTWHPHAYNCFLCNDLKSEERFDCSRENFISYYKAAAIFPLRCRRGKEASPQIIGFLTFDSLDVGVFGKIPNIFEFRDSKRDWYEEACCYSTLVQTGGIMADVLAAVVFPLVANKERKSNGPKK